jgi:hypothetical protein
MRTIKQVITSHSALTALGRQLSNQQALADQVRALLPSPLNSLIRAAVLETRTLSLFVDSPVWASRLRYLAPELIRQLKRQDLIIDQVRTRIVPESRRKRSSHEQHQLLLSEQSAELLRKTAATLTDEPLREAMLRLSSHGRRR